MEEEDQGQLELRVGLGLVNGTAGLVGSLFGTVGRSGWNAKKSGWMVLEVGKEGRGVWVQWGPKRALELVGR